MKPKREVRRKKRLVLVLEEGIITALKVRAARERTTASELVGAWIRSWGKK